MYTFTSGKSNEVPEGGWLKFFQSMSPDVRARRDDFVAAHKEEMDALHARRQELLRELSRIDQRQHWLEGLEEVAVGRATVRSRREGLIVYKYDRKSPTGVSALPGSATDNADNRAEVASVGTVYAGAC